ncbi:hypothetical protein D9M69_533370 [compost metagenome]
MLGDKQAANLQQLIGLLAGQLVGIADGLHLAGRALSVALQLLQCAGVVLQRSLLLIQAKKQRVVGPFLRLGGKAPVLVHRRPLGFAAAGVGEAR